MMGRMGRDREQGQEEGEERAAQGFCHSLKEAPVVLCLQLL